MSEVRHAMAEQDAAILDYLDGLLRESGGVSQGAANLTLVSSVRSPVVPVDDKTDEEIFPDEEFAFESAQADEPEPVDMAAEEDVVAAAEPEPIESQAIASPVQDIEPVVVEEETVIAEDVDVPEPMQMVVEDHEDVAVVGLVEAAEPEAIEESDHKLEHVILSVGSLKLAFPRDEVVATFSDPGIEPLRGAPDRIAGALAYQGKSRMLLSLDHVVLGRAATGQGRIVLMLAGGLWGVVGGALMDDQVVDLDQVKWRSASERQAVRPWLAGLSRTEGVAIVDTAALRQALSGNS